MAVLHASKKKKNPSLTQRPLYYCLKNEKKLIRAPKNKNGNVTGQISSLFKQKTIEQKFDWGIFWKWLKKKKWCPNAAASMEIKPNNFTPPCMSLLSIFSDCTKEGHQMNNVNEFS